MDFWSKRSAVGCSTEKTGLMNRDRFHRESFSLIRSVCCSERNIFLFFICVRSKFGLLPLQSNNFRCFAHKHLDDVTVACLCLTLKPLLSPCLQHTLYTFLVCVHHILLKMSSRSYGTALVRPSRRSNSPLTRTHCPR